jgi:hypothetical protein
VIRFSDIADRLPISARSPYHFTVPWRRIAGGDSYF